jgi:hypothetical protein
MRDERCERYVGMAETPEERVRRRVQTESFTDRREGGWLTEFYEDVAASATLDFELPARCCACGRAVPIEASLCVEPVACSTCYEANPGVLFREVGDE